MAAPIVVARVATGLIGADLGRWAVRLVLLALLAAAVPMALALLGFAALNAGIEYDRPGVGKTFVPLVKLLLKSREASFNEKRLGLDAEKGGSD